MQGFNMGRYVPPELEGLTTGNKLHNKKPPGMRGDKQVIRFEMPFNIICGHCSGHIAQGTRFNAEKKKVGHYHSTPIFAFHLKHSVCGGQIVIQTDPQNTAYVVQEGGKKTAADEEKEAGFIRIVDPAERAEVDPFERREKAVGEKTAVTAGAQRVKELWELQERQWADPYEHSRKLRRVFRAERKVLAAKAERNEALADRAGLHIELLDETKEDVERAKLIEFSADHGKSLAEARARPLFQKEQTVKSLRITPKTRQKDVPEMTKESLKRDLDRSRRLAADPFLSEGWERPAKIPKRRARAKSSEQAEPVLKDAQPSPETESEPPEKRPPAASKPLPKPSLGLVDYSDDD